MRDCFSGMNPYNIFGYYLAAVIMTFSFNEPVCLICSFAGSVAYGVFVGGKKAAETLFFIAFPMMIVVVLINLFFNHHGQTVLFYINNNPSTKEALFFGMATAVMIASVIMWFYSFGIIFDSGKVMYISGRILPMLSLIFAMVMRMVPRFRMKASEISMAMKALRAAEEERSFKNKLSDSLKIISVLITWSLENSIDTAVSMKARGYGLKGRTSFLLYRYTAADAAAALIILLLIAVSALTGYCRMEYYPEFILNAEGRNGLVMNILGHISFLLFCFMPFLMSVSGVRGKKVKNENS